MKKEKYLNKRNQLEYQKFRLKEFTLKNIDERGNYFLEEIELKELMSRNHKKVGTTLSHIEYIFIFASAITGCI